MISVVGGYVCTSCGDEAKAKRGQDPHAKPGQLPNDPKAGKTKNSAFDPAVVFDGALKQNAPASAAKASGNSTATPPPLLDITA
jgi:hypothetical protein